MKKNYRQEAAADFHPIKKAQRELQKCRRVSRAEIEPIKIDWEQTEISKTQFEAQIVS